MNKPKASDFWDKQVDCVQCGGGMEESYGNKYFSAPFCDNHKCPNYRLLQVGVVIPESADKNKLSQCKSCYCMTKTVEGKSGKCGIIKPVEEVEKTRTTKQNKSIHKYCELLAESLNDSGLEFQKALPKVYIPWTMGSVKETIFKAIMLAQLGKKSTTELTTKEVSEVFEVINRHFSENHGLFVDFPSVDSQLEKERTNL